MIGAYEVLRYLFLALGLIAVLNWLRYGRRWRYRALRPGTDGSARGLAALETRLSAVEQLEARVSELENRLDFAERVMAGREAQMLQRGD